ncbi:MAG: RNA polymerase sigma factor [Planctomycetota bacterium]|jgi:RNA polymerase sigma-70 factor (ECF subfamily)
MPSDEQIMSAYVAGEAGAFEALFDRYAGILIAIMRRGYVAEADAEDLTQQVFLQLHRARNDFRPGALLRPWLMAIARNVKRDHWRKVLRHPPPKALMEDQFEYPGRAGDDIDLREALDRAVDSLPVTLRKVVRGYWFDHKSYAEISHDLGISKTAAKVRAHRAYLALRKVLAEQGLNPGTPGNRGAADDVGE